ncbi:Fur family transcriptional regulator [Desulfuribacillus alkaliarsenatis]|uniref:Transcriptional repressor n=1 Tax=Desulfuribacillus alkaliarsenatis TaxID=766136 RepID=A0A1E5G5K8_9FIRM|nr:Fur family transcriptional regulator [Desulfuribacillus alkaliarsenatis]OEF98471.1 transcriptional repressor [Desulfuribacillus alkaliarsenatis]
MESKLNDIRKQLQEDGYKLTPQREATVKILLENKDHLSAEDIYMLVKDKAPDIGLATVYRTLELLSELRIVHKLNFGDGLARYELTKDDEEHHHHHLVCLDCGKLEEFEDDLLGDIEEKIEKTKKFNIIDHRLSFFGYCSECNEKGQASKKKTNI